MEKLENRTKNILNLKKLCESDKTTVLYAFRVIEQLRRKKLCMEEAREIYNQGIQILFKGNAPLETREQNYFLFYPPHTSKDLPVKLKVTCYFSRSDHLSIINNGSPIVGGTLNNYRFDVFSATWMKAAPNQSAAYNFGKAINKIMLNHFNLS